MDRFKKKTDENGERTSLKIKISMRKTAKMIAVVSCTILMLAACSPKKEVISQSVTGNEDKTYDSGEWIVQKNGSLIAKMQAAIRTGKRSDTVFKMWKRTVMKRRCFRMFRNVLRFFRLKTDEQTGL